MSLFGTKYRTFATTFFAIFVSHTCLCDYGNTLWNDLHNSCGDKVKFYCVQNRLINYINNTLDTDLYITDGIYFIKNNNNYFSDFKISEKDNFNVTKQLRVSRSLSEYSYKHISDNNINETQSDNEEEKDYNSFVKTVEKIEDDLEKPGITRNGSLVVIKDTNITNHTNTRQGSLVIRGLNKVTDLFYDKTSEYLATHDLRLVLPQIFFGNSQLSVSPKGFDSDGGVLLKLNVISESARDHGMSKFFHKMFKKKLLTSFLALLLIIKLIKIKLMYVLPFLIGINNAKKLLLKVLLFLFPPLVHLFKLCTFYHAHAAKLHFHHHKVKHHHHHIKVPVPVPVPVPVHKPVFHDSFPAHDESEHGSISAVDYPTIETYDSSYIDHPPNHYGAGHESLDYYTRHDMGNVQQHGDEFDSWGLKDFYTESPGVLNAQAQAFSPYAEQNYHQYSKVHSLSHKDSLGAKKKNSNTWKSRTPAGPGKGPPEPLPSYDPFYSPILQKIDSLFIQLGFHDEGCRERLTCSMYKNPVRFSPHSNLLSTELSRDPNELEKPQYTNTAAIRFYRYVEAARNGQSRKDCLKLYSACAVKTE